MDVRHVSGLKKNLIPLNTLDMTAMGLVVKVEYESRQGISYDN